MHNHHLTHCLRNRAFSLSHGPYVGDHVWIVKGQGPHAGGVRVHDVVKGKPHVGAEWTPGRQHEFVDKYGIARKWGRAQACPTALSEE